MKKDNAVILVLATIAVILSSFTAYILISRSSKETKSTVSEEEELTVKDFTDVYVRLDIGETGEYTKYEVIRNGDDAKVTSITRQRYGIYSKATRVYKADDLIALLNECEVLSWDRFQGKEGKDRFEFTATINGKEITAEGSIEDDLEHFDTLTQRLFEMASGIDPDS